MSTTAHDDQSAPASTATDERNGASRMGEELRAFQIHAAVFAAGMFIIILVKAITNLAAGTAGQWSAWWSGWALIGWGAGIAVHGLVVWLSRLRRRGHAV